MACIYTSLFRLENLLSICISGTDVAYHGPRNDQLTSAYLFIVQGDGEIQRFTPGQPYFISSDCRYISIFNELFHFQSELHYRLRCAVSRRTCMYFSRRCLQPSRSHPDLQMAPCVCRNLRPNGLDLSCRRLRPIPGRNSREQVTIVFHLYDIPGNNQIVWTAASSSSLNVAMDCASRFEVKAIFSIEATVSLVAPVVWVVSTPTSSIMSAISSESRDCC